tara:strand:+ start:180 stop:503 length:324 start_codon:yes stop_codon:yes gene_type:complete
LAFWRSIEDSDDPAMFEAYLNRFPTGAFVAVARLRQRKLLDALSQSVGAPKTATHRTRRAAPEDVTWSSIKFSEDAADFEIYLERYPNGKYAADARQRLQELGKSGN